jgi:hypothetical protein
MEDVSHNYINQQGKAERVLQNILGNLSHLTQRIPMVQVEDLPESMQRQVVGVPRAWVRLFRCLSNIIVFYHDTHSDATGVDIVDIVVSDCICVLRVLAPILYYKHHIVWNIYKRDIRLYLYFTMSTLMMMVLFDLVM